MKINIEKLRNINTVFLFIFGLLLITGICIFAVRELIDNYTRKQEERAVYIVENEETPTAYFTEFVAAVKDMYVFAKTGTKITFAKQGMKSSTWSAQGYSGVYSDYSEPEEIINFYFVSSKDKQKRTLFKNDMMVLLYEFVRDAYSEKENNLFASVKNIYVTVPADTDGDEKLSEEDDTALYVSEYDGSGLKKVSDNIFNCRFIADNTILFCEYMEGHCIYKRYDIIDDKTEIVFTAESKRPEKNISRLQSIFY